MPRFILVTTLGCGLVSLTAQVGATVADTPFDITLPIDATRSSLFHVRDSGTIPRGLARKFPRMRSFRGADDQGRTVRLDMSDAGVRASIREGDKEWIFRPGDTAAERIPARRFHASPRHQGTMTCQSTWQQHTAVVAYATISVLRSLQTVATLPVSAARSKVHWGRSSMR